MMDDHILISDLSELDFPYVYTILHLSTNKDKVTMAYADVADKSFRVKETVNRCQYILRIGSDSVLLAPVCSNELKR